PLRAVDVGEGGAVDDRARLSRGDDPLDVLGVRDVELGVPERHDVVAEAPAGGGDGPAEHAGRAGDEQAHAQRIPISELSPTMKRNARGWPSPRPIVTLRPSS